MRIPPTAWRFASQRWRRELIVKLSRDSGLTEQLLNKLHDGLRIDPAVG